MATDIIFFIIGAALVIFGADWLVDGASAVARRARLSEYVIGATIVGIGTSMPEFVVSGIAAIQGSGDMSVGNVAGSNLFNTLFILGITALILPLSYTESNIRRDIPMCIAVSAAFLLMAATPFGGDRTIGRIEGGLLLLGFASYLWYCLKQDNGTEEKSDTGQMAVWKAVVLVLLGIGALIGGGKLFVDSAARIALAFNVSETVIATTLMAGGTSLPELAVCVVAAAKGREQMAIGNIIGSNISNILLIVGFSAAVRPLGIDAVNFRSILTVLCSAIILMLSVFPLKTKKLSRLEGVFFTAIYIAYIVSII